MIGFLGDFKWFSNYIVYNVLNHIYIYIYIYIYIFKVTPKKINREKEYGCEQYENLRKTEKQILVEHRKTYYEMQKK